MTIQTTRLLKPFFPTVLSHDDKQIIILYHGLFSSQTHTIDIQDILNIEVDQTLGFAEIVIAIRGIIETSSTTPENILSIPKFRKKDAFAFVAEVEEIRKKLLRGGENK